MARDFNKNVSRSGSVPNWYDNSKAGGVKFDAGPYIGIIKNNADPARLGRLAVYIPDLAGDPNDASTWSIVTYASPFYGSTPGTGSSEIYQGNEKQTYGFWAVPPDVGNQVLCTFVGGDPSRGYWFACVPNAESRHMVPGIARTEDVAKTLIRDKKDQSGAFYGQWSQGDDGASLKTDGAYLPATEVNLNSKEDSLKQDLLDLPRGIHEHQSASVIRQGLETDPIRGTITSSSQRESPSRVFGMSTPGRPYPDVANIYKEVSGADIAKQTVDNYLKNPDTTIGTDSFFSRPQSRVGGHTFVLDDGDKYGNNDLVRLRTAGGHTILMHDTENIIYITNKEGNAWIELTPTGAINVYGSKSFSLRSETNINLHADANVNIHAGDSINCYAQERIETETKAKRERVTELYNIDTGNYGLLVGNEANVKTLTAHITTTDTLRIKSGATSGWNVASGEMWLTGGTDIHLNTSGKTIPDPKEPISNAPLEQYQKQDVFFDSAIGRWRIDDRTEYEFESITPFTPTHEPWSRETGPRKLNDSTLKDSEPQSRESLPPVVGPYKPSSSPFG